MSNKCVTYSPVQLLDMFFQDMFLTGVTFSLKNTMHSLDDDDIQLMMGNDETTL